LLTSRHGAEQREGMRCDSQFTCTVAPFSTFTKKETRFGRKRINPILNGNIQGLISRLLDLQAWN
jgi:hypothetical protein